MKKVMLMVLFIIASGVQAQCDWDECPEFNKFLKIANFSRNEKMKQLITDCNRCQLCDESFQEAWHGCISELPDIWFKGNDIERIINAYRMRRCIELNNLTLLGVASKYVARADKGWKVFAERVRAQGGTIISLELIKQLIVLAEETGFRDWNNNWIWDGNKLVCIDTEDNSFMIGMYRGVKGMEMPSHCKFNYVASLRIWEGSMQPDAKEFFYARLNELLNSPEGLKEDKPLPLSTKYDDGNLGIDFEKVKREYQQ